MAGSFNKTSSFINLIFALASAALLAAQDTSATLTGSVRNASFGIGPPVEAALKLQGPPHTLFTVRADDYGNFEFTVLPPGTYILTVRGLGNQTVEDIRLGSGDHIHLPRLHLQQSGTFGPPAPKFLRLLPTEQHVGNLSGRVERVEDHPVARATVKLLCDERNVCGETKTDANGEFIFFNLPPRDDYTIRVARLGLYPWEGSDYEVQAGFDSTYWPIILEQCPNGNCDPRLRPRHPGAIY